MLLPIVITFAVLDIAVYALGVYVNRSWLWPIHNLRFVINSARARARYQGMSESEGDHE